MPVLILVGGPAGAGKSALARAWCDSRPLAAHIQLDEIRTLIVSGLADPQWPGAGQTEQYEVCVRACCDLARAFLDGGFDVAIDDVLDPVAFERDWLPALEGLTLYVFILTPGLDETLRRAAGRTKQVPEELIRAQHAAAAEWDESFRLDTTGLNVEQSLALARKRGMLPDD